jgi:phenylacetate-CoA ligase
MQKIDDRLENQLAYTISKSDFYKKKFHNIELQKLIKEFDKLPFTTKKELLEDQEMNVPFGSNLCVDLSCLSRIHKTSGTTNKPLIIALTKNDIKHTIEVGKSCFTESELRPDDIVFHCLNYNMWAGGYTDHQSLEETGATVVPFGVGNTTNLVQTMLLMKATAIHCTPSYLSKIEQVLNEEFGMIPRDLHLRLGLLGAESGLQNPNFRKSIEDKWGFKAMNANYGMSEVLSMVASECTEQNGLHFRASDKLLVELIDQHSGELLSFKEGMVGELVLTNICKEAQPLIRYRTGDVIKIIKKECSCSKGSFIFEVVGRSDDLLVIKGLNVFVSSIENVISEFYGEISNVFNILISKDDPIEEITIRIEKLKEFIDEENFINKIQTTMKNRLNIHINVEIVNKDSIERTEGKSKKLLRIL